MSFDDMEFFGGDTEFSCQKDEDAGIRSITLGLFADCYVVAVACLTNTLVLRARLYAYLDEHHPMLPKQNGRAFARPYSCC